MDDDRVERIYRALHDQHEAKVAEGRRRSIEASHHRRLVGGLEAAANFDWPDESVPFLDAWLRYWMHAARVFRAYSGHDSTRPLALDLDEAEILGQEVFELALSGATRDAVREELEQHLLMLAEWNRRLALREFLRKVGVALSPRASSALVPRAQERRQSTAGAPLVTHRAAESSSTPVAPRAIVFYRLWAAPSERLDLAPFDHLPHHRLAAAVEEAAVGLMKAEYGSLEAWHEARAEEMRDRASRARARVRGTPEGPNGRQRPSRGPHVRTRKKYLAEVCADQRPLLEQLVTESELVQQRRKAPGIRVDGLRTASALDLVVEGPVAVLGCDDLDEAARVAAHMQRKHAADAAARSRRFGSRVWAATDIVARFGAVAWEELSEEERVDALDQPARQTELPQLAEQALALIRIAHGHAEVPEEVANGQGAEESGPAPEGSENAEAQHIVAPLTPGERAVLDILFELPPGEGHSGKDLIAELPERGVHGVGQSSLTSRVISRLRMSGWEIRNRRGVGYWLSPADRLRYERIWGQAQHERGSE